MVKYCKAHLEYEENRNSHDCVPTAIRNIFNYYGVNVEFTNKDLTKNHLYGDSPRLTGMFTRNSNEYLGKRCLRKKQTGRLMKKGKAVYRKNQSIGSCGVHTSDYNSFFRNCGVEIEKVACPRIWNHGDFKFIYKGKRLVKRELKKTVCTTNDRKLILLDRINNILDSGSVVIFNTPGHCGLIIDYYNDGGGYYRNIYKCVNLSGHGRKKGIKPPIKILTINDLLEEKSLYTNEYYITDKRNNVSQKIVLTKRQIPDSTLFRVKKFINKKIDSRRKYVEFWSKALSQRDKVEMDKIQTISYQKYAHYLEFPVNDEQNHYEKGFWIITMDSKYKLASGFWVKKDNLFPPMKIINPDPENIFETIKILLEINTQNSVYLTVSSYNYEDDIKNWGAAFIRLSKIGYFSYIVFKDELMNFSVEVNYLPFSSKPKLL